MIEEEYARNECGIYKIIGKYERRDPYDLCVRLGNFYTGEFEGEQYESKLKIGKLIDLIEVGDFVNRERILDITGDYIHTNETDHNRFYLEKHIKTILTKEQYKANCYTVEKEEE